LTQQPDLCWFIQQILSEIALIYGILLKYLVYLCSEFFSRIYTQLPYQFNTFLKTIFPNLVQAVSDLGPAGAFAPNSLYVAQQTAKNRTSIRENCYQIHDSFGNGQTLPDKRIDITFRDKTALW